MKRLFVALVAYSTSITTSIAGIDSWTSVSQEDSFTNGKIVQVEYIYKYGTGQIKIVCGDDYSGLLISMLNGEAFGSPNLEEWPSLSVAVDESVIFKRSPVNQEPYQISGIPTFLLTKEDSIKLASAFLTATKQIALKNESNKATMLLSSNGSAKVGKQLLDCLN